MITFEELELLGGLLEALFRKCKSDGLREPTLRGIEIIKRERNRITLKPNDNVIMRKDGSFIEP